MGLYNYIFNQKPSSFTWHELSELDRQLIENRWSPNRILAIPEEYYNELAR